MRAGGGGGERGWDALMASSTQRIWVLATLGDSEGQGSLACCSPLSHKESDMTKWLNSKCDSGSPCARTYDNTKQRQVKALCSPTGYLSDGEGRGEEEQWLSENQKIRECRFIKGKKRYANTV